MFLRTEFNYDMHDASKETGISFEGTESRTKQEFKEDADINTIMKRYGVTGEMPVNTAYPQVGQFVEAIDLHSAMNVIAQATQAFAELPSGIRARFENDPRKFDTFIRDDKNRDEAIRLKLVPEPPPVPPSQAAAQSTT